jgi:hypothetical protein
MPVVYPLLQSPPLLPRNTGQILVKYWSKAAVVKHWSNAGQVPSPLRPRTQKMPSTGWVGIESGGVGIESGWVGIESGWVGIERKRNRRSNAINRVGRRRGGAKEAEFLPRILKDPGPGPVPGRRDREFGRTVASRRRLAARPESPPEPKPRALYSFIKCTRETTTRPEPPRAEAPCAARARRRHGDLGASLFTH